MNKQMSAIVKNISPVKLLVVQATSFCNLDCSYCYLPDRSSHRRLSLDLLESIFKNLFNSYSIDEKLTVVWHAGEPLSIPVSFYESAFEKISKLANESNISQEVISYAVQTNGTLIDRAWCDLIKNNRIKIGVSLDGPAFIHDAQRKTRSGLGSHGRTMRGIQLLQSHDINFHVITVLTQQSLDFPEQIFNFFVEHGIRRVGFNIEEIEGIHQCSSLAKAGTEERYRAFMGRFYELVKHSNGKLKVREFDNIYNSIHQDRNLLRSQLATPLSIISVDAKGSFTTFSPELLTMNSPEYGDFILGNVLHDRFDSVYGNDKFQTIHQEIQAGIESCRRDCEYFSLCGGGAPSNKYFENKSFNSSETMFCRYNKKVIADIILEDTEKILGL
jgi:uncharacterized protein